MNRQLHDEGAALLLLPWVALGVERFCFPLRTADLTRGLIFLNAILHSQRSHADSWCAARGRGSVTHSQLLQHGLPLPQGCLSVTERLLPAHTERKRSFCTETFGKVQALRGVIDSKFRYGEKRRSQTRRNTSLTGRREAKSTTNPQGNGRRCSRGPFRYPRFGAAAAAGAATHACYPPPVR